MNKTGFPTVPTKPDKINYVKKNKKSWPSGDCRERYFNYHGLNCECCGKFDSSNVFIPRKKMQSCDMDCATSGAIGFANGGWMTQEMFIKYMQHYVKDTHSAIENPTLLLLDNHTLHLSIAGFDLAVKKRCAHAHFSTSLFAPDATAGR